MDAKLCDQCKRPGVSPYVGWLQIIRTEDISLLSGDTIPLDFCGWECVGAFAVNSLKKKNHS